MQAGGWQLGRRPLVAGAEDRAGGVENEALTGASQTSRAAARLRLSGLEPGSVRRASLGRPVILTQVTGCPGMDRDLEVRDRGGGRAGRQEKSQNRGTTWCRCWRGGSKGTWRSQTWGEQETGYSSRKPSLPAQQSFVLCLQSSC